MKKVYIFTIGLFLSIGTIQNTCFGAAAAEDVEAQKEAWKKKQKQKEEEQKRFSENLTPEQKDLGKKLIAATRMGDLNNIKTFLSQGAPVNYYNGRFTALHVSLRNSIRPSESRFEILNTLLRANADVNAVTSTNDTPLSIVTHIIKKIKYVTTLIESGANVNTPGLCGMTPLMMAADHGDINIINMLLEAGSVVDYQDIYNGETALIVAVYNGHIDAVRELILAGANPDITDNEGQTAWTVPLNERLTPVTRKQMSNEIQQALEKRQERTEIIEGFLPIRGVANLVTEGYLEARRPAPTETASTENEEKEEEEKKEAYEEPIELLYTRMPVGATTRTREASRERRASITSQSNRPVRSVRPGSTSRRGSFYEGAERAALEAQASREQEGLQPGVIPQPNKETGFYD